MSSVPKRPQTETGYECWLRYRRIANKELRTEYAEFLRDIVCNADPAKPVIRSMRSELTKAARRMTGIEPNFHFSDEISRSGRGSARRSDGARGSDAPAAAGGGGNASGNTAPALLPKLAFELWPVLSAGAAPPTPEQENDIPGLDRLKAKPGSYTISPGEGQVRVRSYDETGLLYAAFFLISLLQRCRPVAEISGLTLTEIPANPFRMIDHWDNMDGSIERGYAGKSIFYKNGRIAKNLSRVHDYARLLASVGINTLAVNNVNVHTRETKLITDAMLPDVIRLAQLFAAWGITLYLSINFASPVTLGDLDTSDPLDEKVRAWWRTRAQAVYRAIPGFGGFLVKADSEGRPGPFSYGRTHADGANMLAEALSPFGGTVIWRCFVYNHKQDWRDRKTDRARAAYDHFKNLDGSFRDNVILQIKNGPMDFQVREPVSPLFGAMPGTSQILELQITQEYTGQQRHLCYLPAQWKHYLGFEIGHIKGSVRTLADVASGEVFARTQGGMAAVSNIGDEENWCGHDLAQANLHGFGRLAWNPALSVEALMDEWIELSFGAGASSVHGPANDASADPDLKKDIAFILRNSWACYEKYTAPLGVGWMVRPHYHYGPDPDGYEYDRWGTYHFADRNGIGVDRSVATGTGYAGQYMAENAAMYETPSSCPDELLLFFHHVPYTHRLKSGKTVIQHIYDSHFEGVEQAEAARKLWAELSAKVDPLRHAAVLKRMDEQCANAREWRDVVNTYFFRKSGILDEKGRKIY